MGRRGMSAQERREYERLQERKKQRIERQQTRTVGSNMAKSSPGSRPRPDEYRRTRRPDPDRKRRREEERGRNYDSRDRKRMYTSDVDTRKRRGRRGRRNERSARNVFGNILLMLQAIVSLALLIVLAVSNIIPLKYMVVIFVCLLLLWLLGLFTQIKRKKKGTGGKIYIVCMTMIIGCIAYFAGITTGALGRISGGKNTPVDTMVVAVRADDPAETLSDAEDYTFGVQYTITSDDMKSTVEKINEDLGRKIDEVEYKDVKAQAKALHDGDVDAIIYNEGYKEVLENEFHGYSDKVKIIYTHNIKAELADISIDVDVTEPFSVYISGIDVYGDISQKSRSDVNIIATVNPQSRQILLVTTPRDYYVPIPEVSYGNRDKLTHAGNYGVDASMRTLSELYDVEIPFYARVNFTSLIDVVDILGGLDVVSEYEFTTSTASGKVVDVKEGLNHFDGVEALAFARERKKVPGGDNQRGKDQQAVLTAMIKKVVSPSMLLKANSIIDKVSGNVQTNMSQSQLQALIKRQLSVGGSWNIKSVAAEGTGASRSCYSSGSQELYVTLPDETSIEMIKAEIDKTLAGETLEDGEMTE